MEGNLCRDVSMTSYRDLGDAALHHVVDYALSPATMVTHLVMMCLLYGLVVEGGLRRRQLTQLLLGEELLIYVLWLAVDHGLRAPFAIWVCITVYEAIAKPQIRYQDHAVLLTDVGVQEMLEQLGLEFDSKSDETDASDATRVISCTGLRVVTFVWSSDWTPAKSQRRSHNYLGLKLESISEVSETCSSKIIDIRLRALNVQPEQCLYLVLGSQNTTVVLIADSKARRNSWLQALRQLHGFRIYDVRYAWLLKLCAQAAADNSSNGANTESSSSSSSSATKLTKSVSFGCQSSVVRVGRKVAFDQAIDLLTRARRTPDENYARELVKTFTSVDSVLRKLVLGTECRGQHRMTWEQFLAFFSCAANRPDINEVYDRYVDRSQKTITMPCQTLHDFVNNVQKEKVSLEEIQDWVVKFEPVLQSLNMSYIGFATYILDDDHSIFRRQYCRVHQDMTQPLSHYFIASSHNTYLTKDQWRSKSSVEMYIKAFERGCKCVELDIWDGANDEPVIYHGYTLTSKILVKDVLQAIRDYAFIKSPYPVILSFENHCSVEQQKIVAQYLTNILGDMLYTKPIPNNEKFLPSPADLQGFIIVKCKKLQPEDDDVMDDYGDDEYYDGSDDADLGDMLTLPRQREERENDGVSISSDDVGSDVISLSDDDRKSSVVDTLLEDFEKFRKMNKEKEKFKLENKNIAQELSDLVVYCQPMGVQAFEVARETGTSCSAKHYQMISFGERRAVRYAKEDPSCLLRYNYRHMTRIYPTGHRFDSSNYDPIPLWNAGCQLVALNYQTPCFEMQLNQAKFEENGLCGYVLKPDFMREENPTFDPRFSAEQYDLLTIRVISGYQLPYKNEKLVKAERALSVQVRVVGVEDDAQCDRTKIVKNNGLNPVWHETLEFKVHSPDLAFVVFIVFAKNVSIAQYAMPYRCLQQGYRRVPLNDKHSQPFPCSHLFCYVAIQSQQS